MINIGDRLTDDVMYLIKDSKDLGINEVIEQVMKAESKGGHPPLGKKDIFEMPVIKIGCSRSVE